MEIRGKKKKRLSQEEIYHEKQSLQMCGMVRVAFNIYI